MRVRNKKGPGRDAYRDTTVLKGRLVALATKSSTNRRRWWEDEGSDLGAARKTLRAQSFLNVKSEKK